MRVRSTLSLVLASGFLALPASGSVIINFASLSTPGSSSSSQGNSFTTQGFTFTDLLNGLGNGLSVWQASSGNLPGLNTANTSLFEFFANSTTRLTQAGNVAFDLNSIDLAQYNNIQSAGTFNVTFNGTHTNNTTVSQTFTVNRVAGTPVLQTFTFSGFTDLVRVDFTQGSAPNGAAFQFDNLTINAAVPEPASFWLSGVSLLSLVWAAKRHLSRVV